MTVAGKAQTDLTKSPEANAKALQTSLKLTNAQTTQIEGILKAQKPRIDSLKKASHGDKDAMKKGMMPIITSTSKQIEGVLTPAQKAQYEKMLAEKLSAKGLPKIPGM
jgi:Spy/CpxP family protein refolding chaperone